MITVNQIKEQVDKIFATVLEARRHIHQHPELSFKETETSKYICSILDKMGIPYTTGHVKTGIVALIKGKNPDKKVVLLRADMDALPITEQNKTEYISKNVLEY